MAPIKRGELNFVYDDEADMHPAQAVNWEAKARFLDRLTASIVLAGGKLMSREELLTMPISELLNACFNNGIVLEVYPTKVREK
jgi:hypothetical protein